jgi:hypothetical protein
MLNGSVALYGGDLFHRSHLQSTGDILARFDGSAEAPLASGVRPAFITGYGGYIYFCDGLSDYNIFRVPTGGGNAEMVSDHMASFLHIYGNQMFYTNHSDRDFLYRMDLESLESAPFVRTAAYEAMVVGGQLYFINGSSGFRIYRVSADRPGAELTRVNQANSDNLRVSNGHIFYRNVEDNSIHRVSASGEPVNVSLQVASFDILGSTMALVEAGSNNLWFYDMHQLVPTGQTASYAAVTGEGMAHVVSYDNSDLVVGVPMPGISEIDEEITTQ